MSKSLMNTISVKELLNSYTANQFRTLCLLSNYKSDLEFNDSTMDVACGVLKKFDSFIANCYAHLNTYSSKHIPDITLLKKMSDIENDILINLADNFNTSKTLNLLIELINTFNKLLTVDFNFNCSNLEVIQALNIVFKTLESFGIDLTTTKFKSDAENSLVIDAAVNFRAKLRQLALESKSEINKQDILKLCDTLRDELAAANIIVQDSKLSSMWRHEK
ncbi:PREDICTED: probable cysteine--tRNA ligase, mitochondrial [Diuraphis noxia]|uniref:probable cysteine--tRNA ligase, mitochondrial n=1 Tax=Diuraphis noxia TaxID=143948 RepID=UPI000763794D|nr:PREDICTED: probable cysteine--tRNA ligase, mitochondrial [Diuraphis noxia]